MPMNTVVARRFISFGHRLDGRLVRLRYARRGDLVTYLCMHVTRPNCVRDIYMPSNRSRGIYSAPPICMPPKPYIFIRYLDALAGIASGGIHTALRSPLRLG